MFGLTALETRLAGYAFVLAAICGVLLYVHHEGYEACRAPEKVADKAQVEKDLTDAKGTIDDLKRQLVAIPSPTAAPVLRLCPQPRSLRTEVPAPGAQPAVAGSVGEGSRGVPAGDAGLDVGPQLQDSKRAAEVIAVYRDTTWEWAVKQAH